MNSRELSREESDVKASFSELVNRFDLAKTITKVAAVYYWNGEAPNFTRPHLAIQLIVDAHNSNSGSEPGLPAVMTIVKRARLVELANLFMRRQAMDGLQGRSLALEWEHETLRYWSSVITNPGTVGQMLDHFLDKFVPHETTFREALGFTPQQACRSALTIYFAIAQGIEPFLQPNSPFFRRRKGPEKYASSLLTPPQAFLTRWAKISKIPPPPRDLPKNSPLNWNVVTFLSADARDFSANNQSFGRWALLREQDGGVRVLVPAMLADTLLSAVHFELFRRLPEPAKGELGRQIGEEFERMVARLFTNNWEGVDATPHVRHRQTPGDTDVVVTLPEGSIIIVQCKARALRAAGRWGGIRTFRRDSEESFQRSVEEARSSLSEFRSRYQVAAVLIVTDAYFPGMGLKPESVPTSFASLRISRRRLS